MYISVISMFVDDVDRAVDFYTQKLGWEKTMDVDMGDGGRWVTVCPSGGQCSFTLTVANPEWYPGKKAGGMSGVIVEVDDVFKSAADLKSKGVEIAEEPRTEPWGGWSTFKDSEGNIHGMHSPASVAASAN